MCVSCIYLIFIKQAFRYQEIPYKLDEKFYLFPFLTQKNYTLSQELFVLFTQIKITAFQVITEENFSRWKVPHFYVKLINILKCSIEICEQYSIKITLLHILEDYADRAALGLLHSFIHDFGTIYDQS